jgi:RNA polymerase sigma-70 factor, ECF subfamily
VKRAAEVKVARIFFFFYPIESTRLFLVIGWRKKKSGSARLFDDSSVELEEETSLMLEVRLGNMDAFKRLYERFKSPILSYVFQLVHDPAIAEEVTQEVFLRVYRNREGYEPRANFSTWLWTIARNAALDHLRKKHEETLIEEEGEGPAIEQVEAPLESAEAALLAQADRARLEHCMRELTAPQREAVVLRTVSELSYEEIASTMRTTLSSIKSLISRAKSALMECLKQEGGVHA